MEKYKYPYKYHLLITWGLSLTIFLITCFIKLEFWSILKSYVLTERARGGLIAYLICTNFVTAFFLFFTSYDYFEKTGKNI